MIDTSKAPAPVPLFTPPFSMEGGRILDAKGLLVGECHLAPGAPAAASELVAEVLADYWEDEGLVPEEDDSSTPETILQRRVRLFVEAAFVLFLIAIAVDRFVPFLPSLPARPAAAAPVPTAPATKVGVHSNDSRFEASALRSRPESPPADSPSRNIS